MLGAASCFQQGVLFEGGKDVLLTDSHWWVTLQYNLTEVEDESRNLSILVTEVKNHFNVFFQNLLQENISMHSPLLRLEAGFRYEFVLLHQKVQEYLGEINDLVTLLPRKREKRGLVDAGGHVLKYLFGTLDNNDLEVIDEKMDYLYDTNRELVHRTKEQVTVLANMQTEVVAHAKTINNVITVLKEYHSNMHETMVKLFNQQNLAQNQMRTLMEYLKLNSALSDTKGTVDSAVQKITKFHEAIEGLAAGKVSSNLLSPHEYLRILQEIEKVLPVTTSLYLPAKLENIHQFYSVAEVHSYTTSHTLRVVMRLPLSNDHKLFQVYDIITYPVYDASLNVWKQWEVDPQKLLISKDRLMYSMYDEHEFDRVCRSGKLTVCPLSNVLLSVSKRPNCAVELFHNEQVKLCERKLITGLQSPVLVRTPSRWIYSASEEHRFTLNCLESDGTLNITSVVVKGVGELNGIDMCDLVSGEFKVPARIHGSTMFKGHLSEIVFPSVSELYTSEEKELFSSEQVATLDVLKGLNERLSTYGVKEYRLEDVLYHLRSHLQFSWKLKAAKVTVAGGAGLLSTLILVYMCYRTLKPVRACLLSCRNRRQQRRSATLEKALVQMSDLVQMRALESKSHGETDDHAETEHGTADPETIKVEVPEPEVADANLNRPKGMLRALKP